MSQAAPNSAFDGQAFITAWSRHVGSTHRYYLTGELVLCWSITGPHVQERETLLAELEADAGNVAAVLAVIDARDRRWNEEILAANARHAARAGQ
jgi:hypothetical protein